MKLKAMVLLLLIMAPAATFAQSGGQKADAELNKVWKQIMKCYKSDKVFIGKLKTAQRAWLKYRDAHIESVFPEKDKQYAYGSIYKICYDNLLEELTNERIKYLKKWVNGIPEGDGCAGSVRTPAGLQKCR